MAFPAPPPLRDADFVEEFGEARLGAQRVSDGIQSEVYEAVVTLVVSPIEPVKGGRALSQASVDGGEIERGNIPRLSDVLEIRQSFTCARGVARDSERVPVQRNH